MTHRSKREFYGVLLGLVESMLPAPSLVDRIRPGLAG